MPRCRDAERALAEERFADALEIALDEWRDTRDPVVADVVHMIDEQAPFEGLVGHSSKEEFQEDWLAVARGEPSSAVIGWLARSLWSRVPQPEPAGRRYEDWMQSRYGAYFARIEALRTLGPDPRIAAAAMALLLKAPYAATRDTFASPIYDPLLTLVAEQGDVRQLEGLRSLTSSPSARSAGVRAYLRRAAQIFTHRLERLGSPRAPDSAEWRALLPRPSDPAPTMAESDLLRMVRDNPSDDGARRVYADLLESLGDPRAELIAFQLVPEEDRTAKMEKRIRSLLRTHKNEWLGPVLSKLFVNVVFERGFLAEATLAPTHIAELEVWRQATDAPELATLHTLAKGRAASDVFIAIATSPLATGMRRLTVTSRTVLDELLAVDHATPIEHLTFRQPPRAEQLEEMAKAVALKAVETLTVKVGARHQTRFFDELASSSMAKRICRLEIEGPPPRDIETLCADLPDSIQVLFA